MATERVEVVERVDPVPTALPDGWEWDELALTASHPGDKKKGFTAQAVTGLSEDAVLWEVAKIEEVRNG